MKRLWEHIKIVFSFGEQGDPRIEGIIHNPEDVKKWMKEPLERIYYSRPKIKILFLLACTDHGNLHISRITKVVGTPYPVVHKHIKDLEQDNFVSLLEEADRKGKPQIVQLNIDCMFISNYIEESMQNMDEWMRYNKELQKHQQGELTGYIDNVNKILQSKTKKKGKKKK